MELRHKGRAGQRAAGGGLPHCLPSDVHPLRDRRHHYSALVSGLFAEFDKKYEHRSLLSVDKIGEQ